MMAIFFALIALVGWGAGDIFITKASRLIGNGMTTFWWLFLNFILSMLYLPFAPPITDWGMAAVSLLFGLVSVISVLWYIKALEIGNASIVGTIAGSFSVVTIPLSIFLFKEKLIPMQLIGIGLIIIGLVLGTLKRDAVKVIKTGKIFSDPGAGLALVVMIIWGIYWALIRIPVESLGWYWAGIPTYFYFLLIPLAGVIKTNPLKAMRNKSAIFIIILASLFTISAGYAFNIGLTHGYSSIVAPVAGASPVLFVILSRFVFKDKLTKQQKMGIVSTLIGIILISVTLQ